MRALIRDDHKTYQMHALSCTARAAGSKSLKGFRSSGKSGSKRRMGSHGVAYRRQILFGKSFLFEQPR
jgi:hypothetical protein